MTLISTMTWTTLSNIVEFYHWFIWLLGLNFEIFWNKDFSNERIQAQIDSTKLMTFKMCFSIRFWSALEIFFNIFQIIFLWWKMTNTKSTKSAILLKLRAWNLRLILYIFKALIRKNSRKHTIVWIILLLLNLSFFFDRSIFFNVLSSRDLVEQIIRENDRETTAIVISFLQKQSQNQNISVPYENE